MGVSVARTWGLHPLALNEQTHSQLASAEQGPAVRMERGNQCIITKESARQSKKGLCLVLLILLCSLRAVPLHFLGVKWISGPHLRTCSQGRGKQPWRPATSVAAKQKVKLQRGSALQGLGAATWVAAPGEAWSPWGSLVPLCPLHISPFCLGSPLGLSVLLTMNFKGFSHP